MQVWVAAVQNKIIFDLIGYDWWIEYINVTILWILILSRVLYSFLISSLTTTQIQIYDSITGNKTNNWGRDPQALCVCYSFICFSLWNFVLKVTLGITWLQSSTSPRAAFSAVIMPLASPEKQVLLHWHCMNCISFFTNVLQPSVEKTRFWKKWFVGWNVLRSHFKHNKNLHIISYPSHIFVFVGTYLDSCEEHSFYNDLLQIHWFVMQSLWIKYETRHCSIAVYPIE